MAHHQRTAARPGLQVFRCEAHVPWQRGSNENMNGLLRQSVPTRCPLRRESAQLSPAPLKVGDLLWSAAAAARAA